MWLARVNMMISKKDYIEKLNIGKPVCTEIARRSRSKYVVDYKPFKGTHWTQQANTAITNDIIQQLGETLTSVPKGFSVHKNVQKNHRPA